MSKSKRNVVDPDDLLADYGADTIRLFSLFAAPPEKDLEWSDDGVQGAFRFLQRVWRLVEERAGVILTARGAAWPTGELPDEVRALRRTTHQTIIRVTRDLEDSFHFNTALAALMELQNALVRFQERLPAEPAGDPRVLAFAEGVIALLTMLAPFAPHMAEELWEMLGHTGGVVAAGWPTFDESVARADEIVVPVQVNGKLRGRLTVPADVSEDTLRELAVADPNVAKHLEGKTVRKIVVAAGRLVSIVAN
jgi:leucyl-tRNA synthetase